MADSLAPPPGPAAGQRSASVPADERQWQGSNMTGAGGIQINGDHIINNYGPRGSHSQPSDDRHRKLLDAAKDGNLSMLKRHEKDADIDFTDAEGMTALHYVCWYAHYDCAKFLLEKGADPNAMSAECGTPLCLAAANNRVETVKLLLRNKAKVDKAGGCFGSPLHAACNRGCLDSLKVLLEVADKKPVRLAVMPQKWKKYCLRWSLRFKVEDGDQGASLRVYHDAEAAECTPLFIATAMLQKNSVATLLAKQKSPDTVAKIVRQPGLVAEKVSALSFLVKCNHFELAEVLLSNGADPNRRDTESGLFGSRPLEWAAAMGFEPCIRVLVKYKARLDIASNSGLSPLMLAARVGHLDATRALVELGAKLDFQQRQTESTALCMATEHVPCVEVLLKRGASPHKANSVGDTPLHIAASQGNSNCARVLLDYRALTGVRNSCGDMPLHVAIRGGHLSCLKILLERGAAPDSLDQAGDFPLHTAAHLGFADCISALVLKNADVNALDRSKRAPLIRAVLARKLESVRTLIGHGADVNLKDRYGKTALHHVAKLGDVAICEKLLSSGAKVNLPSDQVPTQLHLAVKAGHSGIAARLIAMGADVNAGDGSEAPLHVAAANKDVRMVKFLLKAKASVTQQDGLGATALVHALKTGHVEIVKALIEAGSDVNHKDAWERPLLFWVANQQDPELVRLLLRAGADVHMEFSGGHTPLTLLQKDRDNNIIIRVYQEEEKRKADENAQTRSIPRAVSRKPKYKIIQPPEDLEARVTAEMAKAEALAPAGPDP